MQIRTANTSDSATIARFNAAMALESEDVELDLRVLTAGVEAALADPVELSTCCRSWMTSRRVS